MAVEHRLGGLSDEPRLGRLRVISDECGAGRDQDIGRKTGQDTHWSTRLV
ncbi:hypothetical protein [Saccharopolyspora gloriosae]|nr:hypothetical protein [Saccharopolyspora gloriosae]